MAMAIVTTMQPVKHRSWQNGLGQVMPEITLTLTLTLTYTRTPMFDRLQRRNNSHSVLVMLSLCGVMLNQLKSLLYRCAITLPLRPLVSTSIITIFKVVMH